MRGPRRNWSDESAGSPDRSTGSSSTKSKKPRSAFERFLIVEILRLSSYAKNDWGFTSLKTEGEAEIDLIIDRPGMPKALVEIKSSDRVTERDTLALNRFYPDLVPAEAFCLSRDPHEKKIGSVWCLPWRAGIARLGI